MTADRQTGQDAQNTPAALDRHNGHHNGQFFNLLDEPWILVRTRQGAVEELSVLEVFRRAHELDCLAGELPTQDIAILRFLLAILYAVFTSVDEQGEVAPLEPFEPTANPRNTKKERDGALRRWRALWDAPELPVAVIERYLEFYRDRFWLVHPTQPFYQVAGLRSSNGAIKDASQIISDVPSRIERRFFSLRFGTGATELSYSEAARWLIALHAWDYAGKKAVVVDSSGNRGSENGGGTGWLGKLGVLYLREPVLARTLLMNFVLLDQNENLLPIYSPIWEEKPRNALKREKQPSGFVELLTQQSRRVLLAVRSNKVVGATIAYGDVFDKENLFIEQMSSWHKSSEPSSVPKFIPSTHKPERSLWRDLSSLLPHAADSEKVSIAGVINWARMLKEKGMLDTVQYTVVAVGVEYGAMQGVMNEVIADELSINASLLTKLGARWVRRIILALDKTNECIFQLGRLAQQCAHASGNDDGSVERRRTQEEAYHTFDSLFRAWLASVNPETDDLETRILEWQDSVLGTIQALGQELFNNLSTQAIIGRDKADKKNPEKKYTSAAPLAFNQFRRNVHKILKSWKEEMVDE